ncbi:MAG: glycoside hydrolase family 9 protein [Phycisphaerae bacterium]
MSQAADGRDVILGPAELNPWFAFNTWKGHAKGTEEGLVIGGAGVTGNGGGGRNVPLDLSAHADAMLLLDLRTHENNQTRNIRLILVDSDGTSAFWTYPIEAKPADAFGTVEPMGKRTLSNPQLDNSKPGKIPGLDLANIVQWQIHGDWQGKPLGVTVRGVTLNTTGDKAAGNNAPAAAAAATPQEAVSADETLSVVLTAGDLAPWFAFNTWKDKVKGTEQGLVIAGAGVTGNGGTGRNTPINLAGMAEATPVLVARPHEGNQTRSLRLLLKDADGTVGMWRYVLADAEPGKPTPLRPEGGNTLARPHSDNNDVGTTPGLDLENIVQWQIHGDWQGRPLAVTIEQVAVTGEGTKPAEPSGPGAALPPALQLGSEPMPRTADSPVVDRVFAVAPHILAIDVKAGRIERMRRVPYEPHPTDKVNAYRHENNDALNTVVVERDGKRIGRLAGKNRDVLVLDERRVGDAFQAAVAMTPGQYTITSRDHAAFGSGLNPVAVHQKAKPTDLAEHDSQLVAMLHRLYLVLPEPLQADATYSIDLGRLNTRQQQVDYVHRPREVRSEAVHVSQIGFHPEDPAKRAYLSQWLGTGGALKYELPLSFELIDDESGQSVFTGDVRLAVAADEPEQRRRVVNHNLTDVYHLDFAEFTTPGRYRVYVEGVGVSFPFEIAPDAWTHAFRTSMTGFLHHRSGIELAPPLTDYRRPRPMHPADGFTVYASTTTLLDTSMGLNLAGKNGFAMLVDGKTDETIDDAWGGYMDAGDWDRRIQHLSATTAMLELYELFPEVIGGIALRLPADEADNNLPDVIDEALWNLDFYRRLQTPAGGVRGGVESAAHPVGGEASWEESLEVFAYAPDFWSSHLYAAAAARAANVLQDLDSRQAGVYRQSAVRAFEWAEPRYAERLAEGVDAKALWRLRDARNLAALELYRLTREDRFHDIFLEDTSLTRDVPVEVWGSHDHADAAFVYARLDDELADPQIKRRAREAIVEAGEASIAYIEGNAFDLAAWRQAMPYHWGLYGSPQGVMMLVRADAVTDDERYLAHAVLGANYSAGANPMNTTFMSGLGQRYPLNIHHLDSRRTAQPVPVGTPSYGHFDPKDELALASRHMNWGHKWIFNRRNIPEGIEWPANESYFDTYSPVSINEYTVHQSMVPSAYVWGYLAGRPR